MARGNATGGTNAQTTNGTPTGETLSWEKVASDLNAVAATLTEIGRVVPATVPSTEQGKAVRAAAAAISQQLSGYKRAGL